MSNLGPKATGCLVKGDDIPRVCASLCLFGAKFGIGACSAITVVAFSALPDIFGFNPLYLSYLFTFAGIGYVCGILVAKKILSMSYIPLSKTMLATISVHITALAVVFTVYSNGLASMCCLYFVEFIGVGAVDCFATVALCEMWGQRIQPWIQAKSAIFTLGAAVPSLVMQNSNLNKTCLVSAALCMSSMIGLVMDRVYWAFVKYKSERTSTRISEVQLFASPANSRYHATHSMQTRIHIPTIMEEDYTSSELVLLEHGFDNLKPNARESTISEMVVNILDATEYCNVSAKQRNDPFFEPGIIKTLAYATPALITKVQSLGCGGNPPFTQPPGPVTSMLMLLVFCGSSLQCAYNNWIPLYATSVSSRDLPAVDVAGHISCVLHIMGGVGCVLTVPLSVYLSTTTMLRIHVGIVVIALIALLFCQNQSFTLLLITTALIGYGVVPVMPLSLTLLNDYGYSMYVLACSREGEEGRGKQETCLL